MKIEDLKDVVSFDSETGTLFWKERPEHLFKRHQDFLSWNKKNAGKPALNSPNGNGYKSGAVHGKKFFSHRVIFALHNGFWPDCIDHINGDRSDNRLENLRSVSRQENQKNLKSPSSNSSGAIGVSWHSQKSKWRSYINVRGSQISLGLHNCITSAKIARAIGQVAHGFHKNHGGR